MTLTHPQIITRSYSRREVLTSRVKRMLWQYCEFEFDWSLVRKTLRPSLNCGQVWYSLSYSCVFLATGCRSLSSLNWGSKLEW